MNLDKILEMSKNVEIEAAEADGYSPYAIAQILNATLVKAGYVGKPILPQMMYNYAKSGRINGVKGVKRYTEDEVMNFVAKEVAKRTR